MQLYFLLRSLVPGQQIQIESGNYGSWGNYLAKIKTVDKTIHHKNSFISSMASFKTNWRKNEKSLLKDHIFPKQNLFEAAWKKVEISGNVVRDILSIICSCFGLWACSFAHFQRNFLKISYFTSREAKCLVVSDVSAWITSEYEVFSGNRLGPLKTLGLFCLPLFCSCME